MNTVLALVLASVALASAGVVVPKQEYSFSWKSVDKEFVDKQYKVYSLLNHINQNNIEAEYYTIGKDYNVEAHIESYTNKQAVEEFLTFSRHGFLPKHLIFSIYNEKMIDEAISLYHLFYYAKDFETFYKTACWARLQFNAGLFTYAFYVAVLHRADTKGLVLPAPYEVYPYYFINSGLIHKLYRVKMEEGILEPEVAKKYGIIFEDDKYFFYGNYSGFDTFHNYGYKLTYFTEDIDLNTYYYYFHSFMPFWMNGEQLGSFKEHRGDYYFFFHQQLLARYYMERLTNGLGEIAEFSWKFPVQTQYAPQMVNHMMHPFLQRFDHEEHFEENFNEREFVESYEKQFYEFLEQGHFKAYNREVDLREPHAINFVSNYWQSTPDLYEKFGTKNYEQNYQIMAHMLLGKGYSDTEFSVAFNHFETALRDPVFFKFFKYVLHYFIMYKQHLEPYTLEHLHFKGVKIHDVKVDQLVTYFDFYDWDASNVAYYSKKDFKKFDHPYMVRQPRLNHKPFNVNIDVVSEVATDAVVKIFFAPKYDSKGEIISFEENYMNFFELDHFTYKLVAGNNTIVRNSKEFFFFKEDSIPAFEVLKHLKENKVPEHMSQEFYFYPQRLILPRGTKDGFPFQFFVMIYPHVAPSNELVEFNLIDNKPLGYPFDRPVNELYWIWQPNMHFEDVQIYHEGEEYPHHFNYPGYEFHTNDVHHH